MSVNDEAFLDTNALVYFAAADAGRAARVEALLLAGGIVSVQVLNELTLACLRKLGMDWAEVDEVLATVRTACRIEPLTETTYDLGRQLAERYQFRVYDAMIVASALEAGCTTLWSEDMHHGLRVAGQLRIRNPFWPDSVQEPRAREQPP
ncbi:PIN domain-containing protein [Luteimonas arsenica]|uniref:PIN domain-containing protein n=1 Tax=Luteimonas arsenica TaxID=1586242 RepID=UPI001054133F|nr:PIN domain-containing protein [Luteimonas arsenica]